MSQDSTATWTRRVLLKLSGETFGGGDVGLAVMDQTALSLARDNDVRMRVFGLEEPGNVTRVLRGEKIGTLVTED